LQNRVQFKQAQVYALAREPESYDLVWFMGVFYHLRHPLLALDLLRRKTRRLLMFQTLTMPGDEIVSPPPNMDLLKRELMQEPGWPKMAFIEHRLADDPTNWWAPNHACIEALLRSSGFRVIKRPAHEVYLCEADSPPHQYVEQELRAIMTLA
jgi:tRNA (mo5U34)-methyltransferase